MEKQFPIEVMSTGVWNGFTFTLDDLKEMAANFLKLRDVIKPPIKLGHTKDETGAPAYGWVDDLKVQGRKLIAYVADMPELLRRAIKAKRYRRVSSEVFFEFEYGGKKYGKVFSALALLGAEAPAVKDLEDLQAYLSQNTENGTFEKIMAFDSPSDFHLIEFEMEDTMKPEEIEAKLKVFEDKITALTTENAQLKSDKEAAEKAKSEIEAKQFEDKKAAKAAEFKAFCDEQVKAGKMTPAQRDALIKESNIKFTDDGDVIVPMELFKAHVKLADKVLDTKQRVEGGDNGGEDYANVQEEVNAKVQEFMDKKDIGYVEALERVLDSDKDLAKRYTSNYAAREKD